MNGLDAILKDLNDKQLEAVKSTEGYVRVIAGAGTGKTKALTSRYAYIIEGLGISPENILCVTFTNKAANEMKNRVKKLLGQKSDFAYITTYHGFCVKVLREEIHKLKYPSTFIIMDVEDQKTILRQIYTELNLSSKDFSFKEVLSYITKKKSKLGYLEYVLNNQEDDDPSIFNRIFYKYLFKQRKNYALDFDDLINYVVYLFSINNEVLDKWKSRMHYIQVDEAQDSSDRQYALIKMLSDFHKNLFIVGDPDQTIYEWRGAKPEILVNFDEEYPECKTIIMDQNYRSTPQILEAANDLISKNENRVPKNLFTLNKGLQKIVHYHAEDDIEESKWIVDEIKEIIKNTNAAYSNFAILYRSHFLSRNIEQTLLKERIPYKIVRGIGFYERKEIKDTLAYLRLIAIGDDMSFLRIINYPKRGIGKKFIEDLTNLATKSNQTLYNTLHQNANDKIFKKEGVKEFLKLIEGAREMVDFMSLSDFIRKLLGLARITEEIELDGDQERIENIQELINSVITMEEERDEKLELLEYLQEIELYTDQDIMRSDENKVTLMTIHSVKGLEFPYVFLNGFSNGILPNSRALTERKKRAMEEERRLTYVAITRAEKLFHFTDSEGFNHQLNDIKNTSCFLSDIDENLYIKKGKIKPPLDERNIIEEGNELSNDQNLKKGDAVLHPVWGRGIVLELDSRKQVYEIHFSESDVIKPINFDFKYLQKVLPNSLTKEGKE